SYSPMSAIHVALRMSSHSRASFTTLGGVGHCFAWQGTRPTGGVGENYPVRCSAVREAQNRLLCQAFLFVFYGLPNIFRQKSGYFLQYLQFKFLVWWLSKVSNFGETINFQT